MKPSSLFQSAGPLTSKKKVKMDLGQVSEEQSDDGSQTENDENDFIEYNKEKDDIASIKMKI